MGQLLTNPGGPRLHSTLGNEAIPWKYASASATGAAVPTPSPAGADTTSALWSRNPQAAPTAAALATHAGPDPTGIGFLSVIFILLSGPSSDDVKCVWQIHSPHHISRVRLLGLRQQLPCLQPGYLRRRPIRLGSCWNLLLLLLLPENAALITSARPLL